MARRAQTNVIDDSLAPHQLFADSLLFFEDNTEEDDTPLRHVDGDD